MLTNTGVISHVCLVGTYIILLVGHIVECPAARIRRSPDQLAHHEEKKLSQHCIICNPGN